MNNLRRYIIIFFSLMGLFNISACSTTTGMQQSPYTGKWYWVPPNCEQFKFNKNDPDALHCAHNGELTGVVLQPASQSQVQEYKQGQEQEQEQLNRSIQNFNQNLQGINQNMQKTIDSNNRIIYRNN